MSNDDIMLAQGIEDKLSRLKQIHIPTNHLIHGGVYYRTVLLKKSEALSGAIIKIPTSIVISGHIQIFIGGTVLEVNGYEIIPADKNRKQIMKAIEDTYITMCFKTNALTVEEAENEFTDEADKLGSRLQGANNNIKITGVV